jgi:hypothetical protein
MLWRHWWNIVCQLRPACSRGRTFLWMMTALAGMTVRTDLRGVTSMVRALGLRPIYYDPILDFFSQFRIGPRYTHPHLAQPGLQSASGHPSRRGQAGAGGRWDQGRQRLLRNRSHHSQAACPGHPSGHARQEECGGLVSDTPPPPGRSRRRGRPRKYGKKIKVSSLLKNVDRLQEAGSPIYGEAASSC